MALAPCASPGFPSRATARTICAACFGRCVPISAPRCIRMRDATPAYGVSQEGRVKSSRARARSTGPLRFHTDRTDVIGLVCARNAKAGGVSKLASIVTIYNEILKRRPDLLEVLCQDFWRSRPEDEDGGPGGGVFKMPVFGVRD